MAILPTQLSEFATAPPSVRERLGELQKKHEEEFANLLHGKLGSYGSDGSAPQEDPRTTPNGDDASGVVPAPPVDNLPILESEGATRAAHNITAAVKSFDSNSVMVFMSKDSHMFLMSKDWAWVPKFTPLSLSCLDTSFISDIMYQYVVKSLYWTPFDCEPCAGNHHVEEGLQDCRCWCRQGSRM